MKGDVSTSQVARGMAVAALVGVIAVLFIRIFSAGDADSGDWLQFLGGGLGAGLAVFLAAALDDRRRKAQLLQDRAEAIKEVLRATDAAMFIFTQAHRTFRNERWKSELAGGLAARASQLRETLERLLGRPALTDGAIFVGAGAKALMDIVTFASDVFSEENGIEFGNRAHQRLAAGAAVLGSIQNRYAKVLKHGQDRGYLPLNFRSDPMIDFATSEPDASLASSAKAD